MVHLLTPPTSTEATCPYYFYITKLGVSCVLPDLLFSTQRHHTETGCGGAGLYYVGLALCCATCSTWEHMALWFICLFVVSLVYCHKCFNYPMTCHFGYALSLFLFDSGQLLSSPDLGLKSAHRYVRAHCCLLTSATVPGWVCPRAGGLKSVCILTLQSRIEP